MADSHIPAAAIRKAWLDQSLTTADAAYSVGLSRSNLWRRAKALDLPARKQGNRFVMLDERMFARMWRAGVSARELAAHFGYHFQTMSKMAGRLQLPRRREGGRQVGLSVAEYLETERCDRLRTGMARSAQLEQAALAQSGMVDDNRGRPQRQGAAR